MFREEDRRPCEIERQLDEEQGQRSLAARRFGLGEDHPERDPHQRVEYRPDHAERPAWRHEARLLKRIEPGVSVAAVRYPTARAPKKLDRNDADKRRLPPIFVLDRFSHSFALPARI